MIETCLKYFAIAIMAWQQTAVIDISKRPDGPANISFQSRTCSRAGRLARSELQCRFWHPTSSPHSPAAGVKKLTTIAAACHCLIIAQWFVARNKSGGFLDGSRQSAAVQIVLLLPTDVFLKHSIRPAPIPKPLLDSDAVCTLSVYGHEMDNTCQIRHFMTFSHLPKNLTPQRSFQ